ncbi:MAG TPA: hypothetical protein VH165_25115 [Kofleriaceae bacterium]|jgi:hypothetical protein|nr:hypothetical protein [Kofleriaceae bacterium]
MPKLRVVRLAGFALVALMACSKADNTDQPAAGSAGSAAPAAEGAAGSAAPAAAAGNAAPAAEAAAGSAAPAAAAGSAAPAAEIAAGGGRDAVLDAWKADKLVPAGLTPVAVPVGKDCQTGTVEGIEVLLCNFGTPADAKAAEQPGLAWIGQVTGSSQAHGSTLVVIADRRKADPNGKKINRLMKLAPK